MDVLGAAGDATARSGTAGAAKGTDSTARRRGPAARSGPKTETEE